MRKPARQAAWALLLTLTLAIPALAQEPAEGAAPNALGAQDATFTTEFMLEDCDFVTRGANPFFILEPGYRLVLAGSDEGEEVVVVITVSDKTQVIDGVLTRVVIERETIDGELFEVARNYFAICKQTNSVVYFGEDVDFYEDGKIVDHHGSWRAGEGGARPGLIMPGTLLLGARYYQEVAPGLALDRAEILSLSETLRTPLGPFFDCLKTAETTPLEPGLVEFKLYAPGVGLIKDGPLRLVRAFFVDPAEAN